MPLRSKHPLAHRFPASRFFPVPLFLKRPAAGLELTDRALRAVCLEATPAGARLKKQASRELPEGAISAGEIIMRDAVLHELKSLVEELDLHFVHASVPDEKAYLFKTQLPETAEKEIRQNIEFHLDESVPISGAEALFEYEVINRTTHTGDKHIDVAVDVLPRDIITGHYALLAEAGLAPLSFSTPSQALLHALIPDHTTKTFLIVHIAEKKTTIAVAAEGVIRYATTVPFGGEALTGAIEREFHVTKEEALKMKKNKSFIRNRENIEFFGALVNLMSALSDEVKKVMAYWDNHTDKTNEVDQQIEKIILSGDAELHGLDEYLSVMLKKRAEIGNPWTNLLSFEDAIPPLSRAESLEYSVALGLASHSLFS